MIQKKNFCRLINTIHAYHDSLDEIREVLPGTHEDITDLTGDLVAEVVVFLDAELNLPEIEHVGSTISWWIWDCNFGKDHPDISITGKNGKVEKKFHLDTVEKLYDYLVKYEVNYETN